MKVTGLMRFGWGRTGTGVGVAIPVSRCTVSRKSLVVASTTVVGTRRDARERRFMAFKGPAGLDVEGLNAPPPLRDCRSVGDGASPLGSLNGRPGGVVGAVVDCGSDVRHVRSVSTSVSCLGLLAASTSPRP